MKGLFFKDTIDNGFEVISEAMSVRNEAGHDDVMIIVKRLDDNQISLVNVTEINTVASAKVHIGY